MIYFANPVNQDARDQMAAGRLGCIVTPFQGNVTFPDEWDVIADNGCFSNRWTADHWFRWLLDLPRSIRFAVCPDVFDPSGAPCHDATLERWEEWSPRMRRHGFTPAFVCQVGAAPATIPDDAEVIFLGGTTDWKLGPTAADISRTASAAGRWCHMGRVNSKRRLDYARSIGCRSCDGTFLIYGPDKNLPQLLRWLEDTTVSPMLWETSPDPQP